MGNYSVGDGEEGIIWINLVKKRANVGDPKTESFNFVSLKGFSLSSIWTNFYIQLKTIDLRKRVSKLTETIDFLKKKVASEIAATVKGLVN